MIAVRLDEPLPAGVLEGLPHRALGHLGVAAQHPHAVGQLVELAAGHRDADADRQALAERAGGDVGRRDPRRRVALQPRAELAERQQLLVVDRADRLQHRVVQRRRVALGEDQVVVGRVLRVRVVQPQMPVEQDGHQVGGGHRGGGVARAGGGRRADRVHPQLLAELAPEVGVVGHTTPPPASSACSPGLRSGPRRTWRTSPRPRARSSAITSS